jgi:hypothetical protein
MAGFFVFGNPNGEQTSKCDDKTRNFLGSFYVPYRTGIHRKMYRRPGNEMHYVFLIYENPGEKFLDTNGRPGGFFGMDFVLYGKYAGNPTKVFNLLQAAYDEYVKNKVIYEHPNGTKQWMHANLDANNDKITSDIAAGIQNLLQTRQDLNLSGEIFPISPAQNQTQRT